MSQRLSSVLGLKSLNGCSFVRIVRSHSFDTVIEGSKTKSLVQLKSELIHLEFAGGLDSLFGFSLSFLGSLSFGLSSGFVLSSDSFVLGPLGSLFFKSDGLVLGLSSSLSSFSDGLVFGLSSSLSGFSFNRAGTRSASVALAAHLHSLVAQEFRNALSLHFESFFLSEFSKFFGIDVLGFQELLEDLHHGASSVSARASTG